MQKIVMAPVYYQIEQPVTAKVLLDYGCGNGWFLGTLEGQGMELIGFEPDSTHSSRIETFSAFQIFSNLDLLIQSYKGKVDILTMHFVMEHLPNLAEAFSNVTQLLKPGGIFFFTIPNFDSLESRIFGKKWHNLDPPRHLSFPNEKIIRMLSGQYGFRWLRQKSLPFPNGFAGSIPVLLSGHFRFPIFLLMLPFGIIFSRLFPNGIHGYWLVKEL
jgi:2-polyprenyl-3-methyl-5-hydroxy-6-metoxy-1,4-benzoquinol methylase